MIATNKALVVPNVSAINTFSPTARRTSHTETRVPTGTDGAEVELFAETGPVALAMWVESASGSVYIPVDVTVDASSATAGSVTVEFRLNLDGNEIALRTITRGFGGSTTEELYPEGPSPLLAGFPHLAANTQLQVTTKVTAHTLDVDPTLSIANCWTYPIQG